MREAHEDVISKLTRGIEETSTPEVVNDLRNGRLLACHFKDAGTDRR